MKTKQLCILFLSLWAILSLYSCAPGQGEEPSSEEMVARFKSPNEEAKPWTFWYWMYGNITQEGITTDLEAMRDAGLGGAYLMPIRSIEQGKEWGGTVRQLSDEWWEMVRFSMQEADRLGLKLGMHICDGFALAGGPWISPEESMQKVVSADTVVEGGGLKDLRLPCPVGAESFYRDIAVYAIPYERQPDDTPLSPRVTCGNLDQSWKANPQKAVNIDEKGVIRSSFPCYIDYTFDRPVTVRNIEVEANGNLYQVHRMKLSVSSDGKNFKEVKQLVPARQGWQNYEYANTHAIPPTTARIFRFTWTPAGSEPGSEDLDAAKWKPDLKIKRLHLHTAPRIHLWEGKAGLVWRVAQPTTELPEEEYIPLSETLRLEVSPEGTLTTDLPQGRWRIVRIGHTSTGHTNATGGDGKGLECDKFSRQAVRKQFDHWFAETFQKTDISLAKKVLKYMHVDSWECGSQNWSDNFAEEFRQRRGYDLMPYLPLMVGIPMESAAQSEKILRDVRTTIGELVVDVFYDVMAECAKEYDCRFSAECVCPTMVSDGLAHYQKVDLPMGEYWLNSPTHDKPNDMLDAISGAHIYGKQIIQAEGFTEVRGVWDETPAMIKPLLDRNYALGINKLFFHVFTHNPDPNVRPGMTLDGIGLFFQPSQTWWREGKAFVDYATRCQVLLQYGRPVVDIAVYTGEEMPRRAILPERLVSTLPGLFGEARVAAEQHRLANEGQPLRTRPVGVKHSANMADPEDWINPLRGYAYDTFNPDVLAQATAADGRMTLPGGAAYRVVVVPGARPMNPAPCTLTEETQKKLEMLRQSGVIVPALPYTAEDFSALGLPRDVEVPEDIAWTHRSGRDMEIYFISNQKDSAYSFTASFRDTYGRSPELWDASAGKIYRPEHFEEKEGRVEVSLSLDAGGSMFVVFPVQPTPDIPVLKTTEERQLLTLSGGWNVVFKEAQREVDVTDLFDWTDHSDESIRYFSGRASYLNQFEFSPEPDAKYFLHLGEVHDVATVYVNGKECGVAWTPPYEVEITDMLKEDTNLLMIEVTNTWANALRGADKGKAPFAGIKTNARYRLPGDTLLPAGLLGPLSIIKR